MEEIWKDIKFTDTDGKEYDYTGYYQVSNLGRVKSLDRTVRKIHYGKEEFTQIKGRIMSEVHDANGYLVVRLRKDNTSKMFKVHRLVAHMFVENPNPKEFTVVNHKDENTSNPISTNLEWCDITYNTTYGTSRSRCGKSLSKTRQEKYWASKTCAVIGINIKTEEVVEFDTVTEASNFLGKVDRKTDIVKCCRGKRKSCCGYTWHYKN